MLKGNEKQQLGTIHADHMVTSMRQAELFQEFAWILEELKANPGALQSPRFDQAMVAYDEYKKIQPSFKRRVAQKKTRE